MTHPAGKEEEAEDEVQWEELKSEDGAFFLSKKVKRKLGLTGLEEPIIWCHVGIDISKFAFVFREKIKLCGGMLNAAASRLTIILLYYVLKCFWRTFSNKAETYNCLIYCWWSAWIDGRNKKCLENKFG